MSKPYWQQMSERMINVAMAEQRRLVRRKRRDLAERNAAEQTAKAQALARAEKRRTHEMFGLHARATLKGM